MYTMYPILNTVLVQFLHLLRTIQVQSTLLHHNFQILTFGLE